MEIASWVQVAALTAPVVVAIGVAWFTTRSARLLAREQRLIDRRADAYAMLAEFTVRLRQFALIANPDLDDDDPLIQPPLTDEDRYRMFAYVELYGSDKARQIYDDLLGKQFMVRMWVADLEHARNMTPPFREDEVEFRIEARKSARKAKDELLAACEQALDLLNAEMRGHRP